jgi:DNA-binding MarR family transcriptional regulator
MPKQFYDVATYAARDSVGYLIRRLTTLITGRLETAFASQQFTLTQWSVLVHLRDGLASTASDLCCAFQHDSGALTRVLDQLEARGLIVRQRSRQDRRVVELALTPSGHKAIATLLPTVVEHMNEALAPLSQAEFEQFRGTLLKVLEHLRPEALARTAPATQAATHVQTRRAVAPRKTGSRARTPVRRRVKS